MTKVKAAHRAGAAATRSPAVRRARRSPEEILDRIVEAARREFKRCGYAGTTTAAIARKADVTEAQLFRYFGSKANLFRETIFKPLDQHFLKFVEEHLPEHEDDAGRRRSTALYTSELQRFIRANAPMLTSLVVAQTYDAEAGHGVGRIDSLATYFERGAAMMAHRTRGRGKVAPELMVRLAFSSVLAAVMFREWIFPEGLADEAQIEAAINTFVLEGIGANGRG